MPHMRCPSRGRGEREEQERPWSVALFRFVTEWVLGMRALCAGHSTLEEVDVLLEPLLQPTKEARLRARRDALSLMSDEEHPLLGTEQTICPEEGIDPTRKQTHYVVAPCHADPMRTVAAEGPRCAKPVEVEMVIRQD